MPNHKKLEVCKRLGISNLPQGKDLDEIAFKRNTICIAAHKNQ